MFERRSLRWPITLGVIMIVLIVALTVGWILLAVLGIFSTPRSWPLFVTFLAVGTTFLVFVLVGVVMYLSLSIKAINLQRRQSNFMDSVTHELKSPIASLKLCLQTLNRHHVSAEEQVGFLRYMLEDVERLDQLINHLLEAARLDRQPAEDESVEVDLAKVLQQCAEEVRLRYRAPESALTLQLAPALVRARPVDIDVIFRNLLDNAFKYAGTPPLVEVILHPETAERVVAEIRDNGPGIPARMRKKIFRRFVRLGSELEREKPGTGLGLYIVQTLVKRLRGTVRVRDRASEPGTIFEVSLPCVEDRRPTATADLEVPAAETAMTP